MATKPSANEFDAIVIGSGMGGMTTAAALSCISVSGYTVPLDVTWGCSLDSGSYF